MTEPTAAERLQAIKDRLAALKENLSRLPIPPEPPKPSK
jgi:hypothetical protein